MARKASKSSTDIGRASPSSSPTPHETFDSGTRSRNTKSPASRKILKSGPSDSGLKPGGKT